MHLPREELVAAVARWGTPLYVTDLDAAAERAAAWRHALPGALVAYAVKANPDPALLRRLAAEGSGFEVVGPVELAQALRAGAAPERIVVNGVGQDDEDLVTALRTGALVNAESLGALEAMVRAGGDGRIGLRLNPAIPTATHPSLVTGAADAKFGIALDEVPEALSLLGGAPESIGAHIGSGIGDTRPYARLAALLGPAAGTMGAERIDLGGGFTGSPAAFADAVLPYLDDPERLIVEPGRSIVAEAGWLVTRVVRVQSRGHLVTDAGMTELIRPMLYGAQHPIVLLTPGGRLPPRAGGWTVSGPVCEAGDVLARGVQLGERAGAGALLAIGQAGAYGLAMTSGYNGRLRPAQAVLEDGQVRLSRRRERLEDVLERDQL